MSATAERNRRFAGGDSALETGFPGLDLIRFGAAMMVALYHFLHIGPGRTGEAGAAFAAEFAPLATAAASLWVAVPIFFVLSGVVIAFSAQGRSAAEFVRRRALRLYPAAWICATITVLVWPKEGGWERYLRSVTLWPSGPWVSDVYWTLAVEVAFYALVAATLAVGGGRRVTTLGAALALASAGWFALRIVNLLAGDALQPLVDLLSAANAFQLLRNGGFFGLGILLYSIRRDGWSWPRGAQAGLAALAGLAAVISAARGFGANGDDQWLRLVLPPAIWTVAVATIAVSLARRGGQGVPRRWHRTARTVGLATYPLYLVHAELGIALMLLFAPLGAWPALLLALALVFGVVALIMRGEALIRTGLRRGLRRSA